jgi:hypothetical protein
MKRIMNRYEIASCRALAANVISHKLSNPQLSPDERAHLTQERRDLWDEETRQLRAAAVCGPAVINM